MGLAPPLNRLKLANSCLRHFLKSHENSATSIGPDNRRPNTRRNKPLNFVQAHRKYFASVDQPTTHCPTLYKFLLLVAGILYICNAKKFLYKKSQLGENLKADYAGYEIDFAFVFSQGKH
ncbi:hypothetical protein ACTXT7_014548 [Hymenolepis weldensis]